MRTPLSLPALSLFSLTIAIAACSNGFSYRDGDGGNAGKAGGLSGGATWIPSGGKSHASGGLDDGPSLGGTTGEAGAPSKASGGAIGHGGSLSEAGATHASAGSAGAGGDDRGGEIIPPDHACAPQTTFRNLFAELLEQSEEDTDAKIAAAYASLFEGNETQTVYYEKGDDEAYILDVNNADVRSEGLSYGMMIAVQLDKKDVFDRLWRFTKRNLQQSNGYFAWQSLPSGEILSRFSAPDGEEYYVQALIYASKRWGDGEDILNYSAEAKMILDALIHNGNWNRDRYLVTFGIGTGYTDPSYILPAFYQTWACFDAQNGVFWQEATAAARAYFPKTTHPTTGLAPNFSNFDGSPYKNSRFQADAWRVVANIMMDKNFYAADAWQDTFARRYAAFFASAPAAADQFELDGTVTHANGSSPAAGLVAQNALVAFGVSADEGAPFVRKLWELRVPTGHYRYYDGMLYMLGLLHASGRFKQW